jgi:hypothetical protein
MSQSATSTIVSSGGTDENGPLMTGDTGVIGCTAVMQNQKGTDSSASAAVISSPGFVSGTASQLSDLTRDYQVYFVIGTGGGTVSIAIGPTSTPAHTLVSSATGVAGAGYTVRLPAGWYLEITVATSTIASQIAVGC